jgi:hypothetical protein
MRLKIFAILSLGLIAVLLSSCGGNPCNGMSPSEGELCAENYDG